MTFFPVNLNFKNPVENYFSSSTNYKKIPVYLVNGKKLLHIVN